MIAPAAHYSPNKFFYDHGLFKGASMLQQVLMLHHVSILVLTAC